MIQSNRGSSYSQIPSIAIIGGGAASVAFLHELNRRSEQYNIIIYEPKGSDNIGRGDPYQEDDPNLLLNAFPYEMSLDPENYAHFEQWLKDNHVLGGPYGIHYTYYPRSLYGKYLHENFQAITQARSSLGLTTRVIPKSAVDLLLQRDGRYTIKTQDDQTSGPYDIVIFAIGNGQPKDHYEIQKELQKKDCYAPSVYPMNELRKKLRGSIGCLGTNLSMVDLLRGIFHFDGPTGSNGLETRPEGITLPVVAMSRFGYLPSVRSRGMQLKTFTPAKIEQIASRNANTIPLADIKNLVREECNAQKIPYNDLKKEFFSYETEPVPERLSRQIDGSLLPSGSLHLLHSMVVRCALSNVIPRLSREDREIFEKQYNRGYHSIWAAMPLESAKSIAKLIHANSLQISRQVPTKIHPSNDNTATAFFKDGSQKMFNLIVNATTPLFDVQPSHPLIANLIENRTLRKAPDGKLAMHPTLHSGTDEKTIGKVFFLGASTPTAPSFYAIIQRARSLAQTLPHPHQETSLHIRALDLPDRCSSPLRTASSQNPLSQKDWANEEYELAKGLKPEIGRAWVMPTEDTQMTRPGKPLDHESSSIHR